MEICCSILIAKHKTWHHPLVASGLNSASLEQGLRSRTVTNRNTGVRSRTVKIVLLSATDKGKENGYREAPATVTNIASARQRPSFLLWSSLFFFPVVGEIENGGAFSYSDKAHYLVTTKQLSFSFEQNPVQSSLPPSS